MENRLVLLGGGGLALEMLDYLNQDGYSVYGYYAPEEDLSLSDHILWLGDERDAFDSKAQYIIASGLVSLREKMISFIEARKLSVFSFVSSKAWVSSFATIGKGCFITPFVSITGNPIIGSYFFANALSNVGHHCKTGTNVVIGPGARVNGHCILGNNVSLGANASLVPGTILEDNVEIGILTYPKKRIMNGSLVINPPGQNIKK